MRTASRDSPSSSVFNEPLSSQAARDPHSLPGICARPEVQIHLRRIAVGGHASLCPPYVIYPLSAGDWPTKAAERSVLAAP
jgi:hypothetical protein